MNAGSPAAKPEVLSLADIPEHELLCPIASGAYGQVWLARNRLGVYRAVKIVHRASFDHDRPFEREFAGIKAFEPISRSHEGLVDLLQVGRDDEAGYFYYVMELADNLSAEGDSVLQDPSAYTSRTLASEVKRGGRLPLDGCIRIGLSLTEALAYLHGQELVHRDIKPSNIIFVGGSPKLADVGLVTAVADARSFVGTEGFIAPEGPGTRQADLYSLGIVLYVLSTGKSHQDFPEPPADLSAQENHTQWLEFNAVVHKACQARVNDRYQSAEEMRDELALLQRGQSVKGKRAVQRRWRVARQLGLAAFAVALLLAPLAWFKQSSHGYTPKPEAARLYEQGRWHYSQLTDENHAKAFTNLTLAIQKDPKYLQPYGELTMLYVWRLFADLSNEETLRKTTEIADKVLAVDSNAAEGHVALSWCHFLQRDWRGAEDEIVRSIKLNHRLAIAYDIYCFYLSVQGRTDEAQRIGQQAQELEPPSSARVTAIVAAWPFIAARRFDQAIGQLRRCLELDSNFPIGHHYLGRCYEAQSNYVAAIEELKTFELLSGRDQAKVTARYAALRKAYDSQGEQGYFRQWIEKIHADEADGELVYEQVAAGYYAMLGEKDKALKQLEEEFETFGVWQILKFEVHYDPLHSDPRFKALVKRAGLPP